MSLELNRVSIRIDALEARINGLADLVKSFDDRIKVIEQTVVSIQDDVKNEIFNSSLPVITAAVDSAKPEFKNFIKLMIKEEFRLRGA